MEARPFAWRDLRFTIADAVSGARLIMLPYLIYGLTVPSPGLAVATLAAMIGTDLIDGRIARGLGQSRQFGAAFDSTIDFVVIYSLFTTFFLLGTLPWWKWLVVFGPALLMAWAEIASVLRSGDLDFPVSPVGKLVGQIQMVYLPLLLARRYGWSGPGVVTADHLLFAVLAAAIAVNTAFFARVLGRLLAADSPSREGR